MGHGHTRFFAQVWVFFITATENHRILFFLHVRAIVICLAFWSIMLWDVFHYFGSSAPLRILIDIVVIAILTTLAFRSAAEAKKIVDGTGKHDINIAFSEKDWFM